MTNRARCFAGCLFLTSLVACEGRDQAAAPSPAAESTVRAAATDDGVPDRDHFFVYQLRGKGRGIDVTYVRGDGRIVRDRVDAPWTSREMSAPADAELELEAKGPRGARLECALRWRAPKARYGGNNSGESSQINDAVHTCKLDLVSPS